MLTASRHWLAQRLRERVSRVVARAFPVEGPPLFDTVELELRTVCNGTCTFCAAAVQYQSRPDRSMPEVIFDRVIAELARLDYAGRLCFYVNTEPLVDPRLPVFVSQARAALPRATLHVMTNGLLLTPERARDLLDRGCDLIEINHYADSPRLRPLTARVMDTVASQYPGRITLSMRRNTVVLNNRAGSSPNGRRLRRPLRAFCQRPFQKLMISVDGTVGLCEHDFYFTEVMGDVSTTPLDVIWRGPRFRAVRAALHRGDRTQNALCAQCDYSGYRRIANPRAAYRGLHARGSHWWWRGVHWVADRLAQ